MKVKKGQTHELEITGIAFGGKGLARIGGMAVFVDQAIAGDRVLARIVKKKKSYAEARVVQRLESSSLRVDAPCPYSGLCGGCKWQFLGYEQQLIYKQQHVQEALDHIGLIKDVEVHPTIASDRIFGYRNKMEFSCAERRWLLPQEMGCDDVDTGMALGLHVPGTFYKVLDIEACLLQPDLGNHILSDVRQYIKKSPRPVYGLRSHEGFWRFLVLRHSVAMDQWMVNIVTASEDMEQVRPLADQLMLTYKNIASVVNNITASKAGVAFGEKEIRLSGDAILTERIGEYEFEISANSFFQTNTLGAQHLYNVAAQYAELSGDEVVVDLYCGAGSIAIYIADKAKEVIGMEITESAVEDAERNCRRNGIRNCRFIGGDIRFTLPQLGVRPDAMIIDPPRAGMHKDVVKEVLSLAPERIVYVSCNPATMARDIALLKDLYDVVEVQPVDMFPHTFHIESVAKLVQRSSRP
ncbi:MAG: 23S rRNA (uracil(1939)-C(5))-methyltransferase RlmD [Desulfobacteraceae bacterium]|jgi:23S rRNA (uracil1939-C5)-methyltransferase